MKRDSNGRLVRDRPDTGDFIIGIIEVLIEKGVMTEAELQAAIAKRIKPAPEAAE